MYKFRRKGIKEKIVLSLLYTSDLTKLVGNESGLYCLILHSSIKPTNIGTMKSRCVTLNTDLGHIEEKFKLSFREAHYSQVTGVASLGDPEVLLDDSAAQMICSMKGASYSCLCD